MVRGHLKNSVLQKTLVETLTTGHNSNKHTPYFFPSFSSLRNLYTELKSILAYPPLHINLYNWCAKEPKGVALFVAVLAFCANPRSFAINAVPKPPCVGRESKS